MHNIHAWIFFYFICIYAGKLAIETGQWDVMTHSMVLKMLNRDIKAPHDVYPLIGKCSDCQRHTLPNLISMKRLINCHRYDFFLSYLSYYCYCLFSGSL